MNTRHIADLLFEHDCVIIPGLGGFIKACLPANINHETHCFSPPAGNIAFNAGLSGNDGLLANHVANTENTTYREALYDIRKWSENCLLEINKGNKFAIEGIGTLILNTSGNIEFEPNREINFYSGSFGLPVFTAIPSAFAESIPRIRSQQGSDFQHPVRHLFTETLKWAAVLAPFIAFILWGTINNNLIDNYIHNYTGMYSWVRSTPGKTAPISSISTLQPLDNTGIQTTSPSGILTENQIEVNPAVISYAELNRNDIHILNQGEPSLPVSQSAGNNYHVICGAFRDQDNAQKLLALLRQKGYPATIVDTTKRGLFVVSIEGFTSMEKALGRLRSIKNAGYPSAWIMKKSGS